MPLKYQINDNLVHVVLNEGVEINQLVQHQIELAMDNDFDPNGKELIDARAGLPGRSLNFRGFSSIVDTSPWKADAQRAILVSNIFSYGIANIFATLMSDKHGHISVFKDEADALEWLGMDLIDLS